MGSRTASPSGIAGSLFPKVMQRVLGLLFGQPDRRFQGAELIRLVSSGSGAVHRVLKRLTTSGLVSVERVGSQRFYRANHESPVFEELRGLMLKTVGLASPLREALAPMGDAIRAAFVFGSIAKGDDSTSSDIDLMIVGAGIDYSEVFELLQGAEEVLQRTVNPHLLTPEEWRQRLDDGSPFLTNVAALPKLFVVGTIDDLD